MQSGDEALQNDKPNDAITAYNIALSLAQAPLSDAEILTRRGAAYYQKGEFDMAIADYYRAIELYPQNQRARDLREAAQRRLEN